MRGRLFLSFTLLAGLVLPLRSQTATPAADAATAAEKPATVLTPAEIATMQGKLNDWPQLNRYRKENAALAAPAKDEHRVVFYGDSITDAWGRRPHSTVFFPGKPYVNRGISGQTTPQMLVRFQQDVVALRPEAVLLLGGTNDIAGNTGPSTLEMTADNVRSMAQIAKANHIRFIVCSVLPASVYKWRPGVKPAEPIRAMNAWLKQFAAQNNLVYVDYYSALTDAEGGMKEGTSLDGVHPTAEGYAIMAPLAEAGIAQAMKKKP